MGARTRGKGPDLYSSEHKPRNAHNIWMQGSLAGVGKKSGVAAGRSRWGERRGGLTCTAMAQGSQGR